MSNSKSASKYGAMLVGGSMLAAFAVTLVAVVALVLLQAGALTTVFYGAGVVSFGLVIVAGLIVVCTLLALGPEAMLSGAAGLAFTIVAFMFIGTLLLGLAGTLAKDGSVYLALLSAAIGALAWLVPGGGLAMNGLRKLRGLSLC